MLLKESLLELLVVILAISALCQGCSKEDAVIPLAIDQQIFFSIIVEGKEYTSYGFYHTRDASIYGGQYLFEYPYQDAQGSYNEVELTIYNEQEDSFRGTGGRPTNKILSLGNCMATIRFSKRGDDFAGLYTTLVKRGIYDYNEYIYAGDKVYQVDPRNLYFNLYPEAADPGNNLTVVAGRFNIKVYESANPAKLIPATGSFRLKAQ